MRAKLFVGLLISLMVLLCSHAEEITKPVSYQLKVQINPASGEIFVDGNIVIELKHLKQNDFSFDFHETFTIDELLIDGKPAKYSTEKKEPWPIQPAAKKVMVELPEKAAQRQIEMKIKYHGILKELPEFGASEDQELALDDQINARMVELASYSCWYPCFVFGNKFDIDLEVSLPLGWKCACSGSEVESSKLDDRAISQWFSRNDTDIIIVASPHLKCKSFKTSAAAIDIYYTQLPEDFIAKEVNEIAETLKLYTQLLGELNISEGLVKHIYSPKKKGQGGAGIGRPGLIVTSEGRTLDALKKDPGYSLFHGIAHEIGHFWWSFGTGQGDWINETFAEYFSLIAVQRISSKQEFEKYIRRYEEYVNELPADAPSLSTVPFLNDKIGYVVRYYKGSLMLDYFRNLLGDEEFFKICHDFYQKFNQTVIGTAEFRSFWGERLGEHKKELNIWLDSKGGVPEIGK
jgi:hypothetical protein